MRTIYVIILAMSASLAGCSSEILVKEIPNNLKAGSTVEGIPFRVPKRFSAKIYEKQNDGYKEVATLPVTLPDPDRLYTVNFNSQALANPTFDLMANADNTLQQVSLKSKSKGSDALTAVGAQLNSAATALQSRKTAGIASDTATANSAIAADKAYQAAELAILQYKNALAKPDVTAEDLLKASQLARSTQLDANEKARLAGKPSYFPEIIP
jgi:hypothetical protein